MTINIFGQLNELDTLILLHNQDANAHPGLGGPSVRRVSSSDDLLPNDRVLVDALNPVDLRLPNVASDNLIIVDCLSPGFAITQRSGQQVSFNDANTTLGTGGSISLLETRGAIALRWISGSQWTVVNCVGNFEVM